MFVADYDLEASGVSKIEHWPRGDGADPRPAEVRDHSVVYRCGLVKRRAGLLSRAIGSLPGRLRRGWITTHGNALRRRDP